MNFAMKIPYRNKSAYSNYGEVKVGLEYLWKTKSMENLQTKSIENLEKMKSMENLQTKSMEYDEISKKTKRLFFKEHQSYRNRRLSQDME